MKQILLGITILVVLVLVIAFPLHAQPGLPNPPDQAPVWTPIVMALLGATFFGIKLMRRNTK